MKKPLYSLTMYATILLFLLMGHTLSGQYPPKTYTAFYTNEDVDIDGEDNEKTWQEAKWTSKFIDIEGKKVPKFGTRIKMAWSPDYFYVFAEMEEPHVWGNLKQRDTVIFYNNDFEVFIDPDGDTHNYYELEINALNTFWDLFLTKPYRNGGKVLDSWDIQGLKSAVRINGTINNALDKDMGWSLEIAIPWKVLVEASNNSRVPENEFWRINFSRVNWDYDLIDGKYFRKKDVNDKYLPEYNWVWSPQEVVNMHEPERWGYVYFSKDTNSSKSQFEVSEEERIKWKLYNYYRHLYKNIDFKLPKELEDNGKTIPLYFKKNDFGWNLWTLSPLTNEKLIIRDDGKFYTAK
ncbi:carbohydrate-binding family 9-like protein [Croceitalea sp. MTPC9]|uniref:carbohydrate-binding family 9-like protein n=2 Tax=unclassified Croceitalea TaxID=2632280 RepID=UPI0030DDA53B